MSPKSINPSACPAAIPGPGAGHGGDGKVWVWWEQGKTPNLGPTRSCFEDGGCCNREGKNNNNNNKKIRFNFTPSNDILTASISGMALLFSFWSSINALPQNSYEPAGLFHSPGCELLSAFPPTHLLIVFIAHGSGSLSPARPQNPQLLSLSFGWGPPSCRGRLAMLKRQTWRRKTSHRLVFHQAEGSVPQARRGQDQVKLPGSGHGRWMGRAAGFGMLQGLQEGRHGAGADLYIPHLLQELGKVRHVSASRVFPMVPASPRAMGPAEHRTGVSPSSLEQQPPKSPRGSLLPLPQNKLINTPLKVIQRWLKI